MSIDIRLITVILILIMIIVGVLIFSRNDNASKTDVRDILKEAVNIVASPTENKDTTMYYDEPTSDGPVRGLYITSEDINVTPATPPTAGENISQDVTPQDTVREPIEQEQSDDRVGNDDREQSDMPAPVESDARENDSSQLIEQERRNLDEFRNETADWLNPNINAAQARSKAAEIRNSAEELRSSAASADPSVRNEMLERARYMEEVAGKISATRGNAAKLRALERSMKEQTDE